ncbi:hypothetical protein pdam_00023113 [Pocillopora damicornis]|uniref:Uncharacterized protein n=1 Tax=Pocillopora damicornis TaxID=46731 RepID=A0A3M6TEE1_POCDA|nr:hypothetical protein pdam_00023113 [Pocillopora damicornis]
MNKNFQQEYLKILRCRYCRSQTFVEPFNSGERGTEFFFEILGGLNFLLRCNYYKKYLDPKLPVFYKSLNISGRFRILATNGRFSIVAISGLFWVLDTNDRFWVLSTSGRFWSLNISGRFWILPTCGRFCILATNGRFGFWTLVADITFWPLVADFGFWSLMADFGFWSLMADFGFWSLMADFGSRANAKISLQGFNCITFAYPSLLRRGHCKLIPGWKEVDACEFYSKARKFYVHVTGEIV